MAWMTKKKALNAINKVVKQVEETEFYEDYVTSEIAESIRNVGLVISRIFGSNSSQFLEFKRLETDLLKGMYDYGGKRGRKSDELDGRLRSIKYEIENFWEDEGSISKEENLKGKKETKETSKFIKFSDKKVFIIHGHDEGTKEKVARFLMQLKLEPIILHEKPNEGKTIIEKFEKHSFDAGFAIALLTPDDVGNSRVNEKNLTYRARQNVILELGYFIGKLGRKRVCALLGKDVEIPSDYSGILYIPLEEETWKFNLAKELKNAGFKIDMNKVI
ncbi:hypothetical protein BEH94_04130 [Candidatus Altiarchaeales archaeon WOR_SM1_SCG]|nr:hypothetical protein BEH94_04130 [Candidatus Altiarchaeales archaeon WOR_SM1_SCG]